MNYQEALDFIHGTYKFGSKLGLENINYLLQLLGNPHEKVKVIHVAGTNGKGSTSSMIHSILKEEGYKVGLYTSPYLETFTERIQINGVNIPEERLAEITNLVKEKIQQMVAEGKNHPTEFEVVTAIGFYYFATEAVDYLVLEVGLGGRLDATNVVGNPLVSAITPIGFDHMQFLGNTLDKIAAEKGGIIKENSQVILYPQGEEVVKVIREICDEKNSPMSMVDFGDIEIHSTSIEGQKYSTKIFGKEFKNVEIHMAGIHQIYNSTTALAVVETLRRKYGVKISDESIYRGLKAARWPGRLEVLRKNPLTIIDGAHNTHGAEALKKSMETLLQDYPITLLIGMLADKDVEGYLELIIPHVEKVVVTEPDNPRAMKAEELAEKMIQYNKDIHIESSIPEAVKKAMEITEDAGAVVCAGSLYMIGEVRKNVRLLD
ncbi:bifunctional folylpolyglutamate synthase/dihydrofolate synthase [Alkaliphilus hydrothermalis]|uniref:tetrahydrofolate synthase n=1 Tax=Alkaliphilus hydrothermalis TaxID=1482730 RepID=A0ABS2NU67_9FIRM|nr:folylpolyglutamate synthase/dihydrofolate synthase family protein [Alkaliphilus hydrothermalis]MBM7616322.1 dihydrofolate synthase/folylpolyglutamate synthase [Alkaliphilus hydrothermalis]